MTGKAKPEPAKTETAKQESTKQESAKPEPNFLPSQGGTYERQKDGSLKRLVEAEGDAATTQATNTASPPQED